MSRATTPGAPAGAVGTMMRTGRAGLAYADVMRDTAGSAANRH
jgi:hypothetical protein